MKKRILLCLFLTAVLLLSACGASEKETPGVEAYAQEHWGQYAPLQYDESSGVLTLSMHSTPVKPAPVSTKVSSHRTPIWIPCVSSHWKSPAPAAYSILPSPCSVSAATAARSSPSLPTEASGAAGNKHLNLRRITDERKIPGAF